MKCFVSGGSGFIGSNLVDRLIKDGNSVTVYDNFSTGLSEFLFEAKESRKLTLVKGDVLDLKKLTRAMHGSEFVFHFAANADVRFGLQHTKKDLEQNTIATYNVLESIRINRIKKIAFSSTGSVYGEAEKIPTPENTLFPIQTSLYGASKLAGEGLISAFSEGFGIKAYIFRFVSILGERYTHGHVIDFYKQLIAHPDRLNVLGDGRQRKSYLYVGDCVDAIMFAIKKAKEKVNIYNLGTDEYCQVNDSIKYITAHMGLKPKIIYSGGDRGWIGDNPFIYLDTRKISRLGWKPKLNFKSAIIKTVEYLERNRWVLEKRK